MVKTLDQKYDELADKYMALADKYSCVVDKYLDALDKLRQVNMKDREEITHKSIGEADWEAYQRSKMGR